MPFNPSMRMMGDLTKHMVSGVFLDLATHPDGSLSDILARSSLAESEVQAVLDVLAQRGFIEIDGAGTIVVTPPELSMAKWSAHLENAARMSRSVQASVNHAYLRARGNDPIATSGVSILSTPLDLRTAISGIVASGHGRLIRVWTNTEANRAALLQDEPVAMRGSGRSPGEYTTVYSLYDSRMLNHEGILDALLHRRSAGEELRLGNRVPIDAIAAEGSGVVISLAQDEDDPMPGHEESIADAATSTEIGILLATPGTAHNLLRALLRTWEFGVPLPDLSDLKDEVHSLSSRDLTVLALMASGVPDSNIARQLGVSSRTVERRVAHIIESLGCTSRFQAGVEAARRSLV